MDPGEGQGGPRRRSDRLQRSQSAPTANNKLSSGPKAKKTPSRTQYTPLPYGGVETAANRPLAASTNAQNNATETILYNDPTDPNSNRIFNLITQVNGDLTVGTISKDLTINRGTLSFVFYKEPNLNPIDNRPELPDEAPDESIPNFYRVFYFTPTTPFTDGMRHQCLGVLYNGKRLKLKFTGSTNPETGLPFFYVEEPTFDANPLHDPQNPKKQPKWIATQTRWYGTFINMPVPSASQADYDQDTLDKIIRGELDFGRRRRKSDLKQVNKVIGYLKSLKC
jgi:hypothetical protein